MTSGRVRALYMRGGTSRALMFHRDDLPQAAAPDYAAWAPVFLGAIGSPDPNGRQLNGIGGGITSLSKVAVIGPPSRPDADVDYTFGQVGVTEPTVSYRGNCGNISSAVGPFAVDQGLVAASGDRARVRIHNTNTGKIIAADFPLRDGKWSDDGDFALDGVAGSGAPIRLSFLEPGGATTGQLLPTGKARQMLRTAAGEIEVSLIDAANPVCFARAADLGLTGRETPDALAADPQIMALAAELRVASAVEMGLSPDEDHARRVLTNLPLVALVAAPDPARSEDAEAGIVVRMFSADQPHKATPLTGALCLAVAAALQDSLVRPLVAGGSPMVIRHASGSMTVEADINPDGSVASVSTYRTARRVMAGDVYY